MNDKLKKIGIVLAGVVSFIVAVFCGKKLHDNGKRINSTRDALRDVTDANRQASGTITDAITTARASTSTNSDTSATVTDAIGTTATIADDNKKSSEILAECRGIIDEIRKRNDASEN